MRTGAAGSSCAWRREATVVERVCAGGADPSGERRSGAGAGEAAAAGSGEERRAAAAGGEPRGGRAGLPDAASRGRQRPGAHVAGRAGASMLDVLAPCVPAGCVCLLACKFLGCMHGPGGDV